MSKDTTLHPLSTRQSIVPVDKFTWQQKTLLKFDEEKLKQAAQMGSANTTVPTMKLAGLVLSTHANSDGGSIFASIKTLALEAAVSERVFQRARRALEDVGLVTFVAPARGERGAEYRLSKPTSTEGAKVIDDIHTAPTSPMTPPTVTHDTLPTSPMTPPTVTHDTQPDQDQVNYHTTTNAKISARARRVAPEESEIKKVSAFFQCSMEDATAMLAEANSDPATVSAINRLLKVSGYGDQVLRRVRDEREAERRKEYIQNGVRLRALSSNRSSCRHGEVGGLAPTAKGEPKCPMCRNAFLKHGGRGAITMAEIEELEREEKMERETIQDTSVTTYAS